MPEQDEDDNYRAGFEVNADMALRVAKSVGEYSRNQHGNDAEKIGCTDPDRDQGKHVQIVRYQRVEAAHEERPTRPENNRRPKPEFDPESQALAKHLPREAEPHKGPHRQDKKRNGQHRPYPEAALKIDQFRIRALVASGHSHRLERHAADRAIARPLLFDLGVHWASKNRSRWGFVRRTLMPTGEIIFRIGHKFVAATRTTEVVQFSLMLVGWLAGSRVYGHPADGVGRPMVRHLCGLVVSTAIVVRNHGCSPLSR